MDESTKSSPCKECNEGVDVVQLHTEVEHLRQHLAERDTHIVAVEAEFIKCTSRAKDLEEQVDTWREKYERLYDSHKRVQKLNQVLEDKLLQMVDKMKVEKSQLTKDIATLSVRLAEAKHDCNMLEKENERYKNDMNLAIQLLQCKPDNFVSQKLDNLPVDTQTRVSQYVMSKTSKPSSSTQSKNGNGNDTEVFDTSEYEFNISASLMSKILEDSIQDTITKHCDTCTCNKNQNKPFCYNESFYSVATQTMMSGEMKNSFCLNCNSEITSIHSNISIRSCSPLVKLVNDKMTHHASPLYILPQEHIPEEPAVSRDKVVEEDKVKKIEATEIGNADKVLGLEAIQRNTLCKVEDLKQLKKTNSVNMEPAVHHKLCDRTRTSISSKKSSIHSVGHEELPNKDVQAPREICSSKNGSLLRDNVSVRKNSQGSMGAISRTSSAAKSTVSTHKSNTQVGPGPRFCHLRMQAGSRNILLDNAQPDVPPVLYRRQSKCNENSIFKDLNDGLDDFIDFNKNDEEMKIEEKNSNVVVESTLIDVHVDNNNKESTANNKPSTMNPVLMNVSSSPLQPLKTHNYSNSSENNNNKSLSNGSCQNTCENDNLLNNFNLNVAHDQSNNNQATDTIINDNKSTPTDDVKIFNFDRYEQKIAGQYNNRSLKKIDMSQLHSIENTRISKDFPPLGELPKLDTVADASTKTLPAIVNVYPNLTQTHLKVNDKNVFTNEQSTSSLSSDDSAALLQKQQLLRVAEWVDKNMQQQNNFKEPLDDDLGFGSKAIKRETTLSRLTETLNELALNMPHPVSKYSKSFSKDVHSNWVHSKSGSLKDNDEKKYNQPSGLKIKPNIVKETIFPVECGDEAYTEVNTGSSNEISMPEDVSNDLQEVLKANSNKEITPEELARMEYNVKRFLLSGPQWIDTDNVGRSRRTSSKTETDV